MASRSKARLEIRQAKLKDVRAIGELVRRAYDDLPAYTQGEIRGQINNYPEGCFVAKLDGEVVGYCASMRLDARVALSDHTWDEVTGNGFGSRHDPTGDWLYGYEMCVDPQVRGTRLGRRLYEERRALAERLDLTGIVFGGRMPGYARAKRRKTNRAETPQEYLDLVIENRIHDPVLRFQLANGFEPGRPSLSNYLPEDKARPRNVFSVEHGVAQSLIVDSDARPNRLCRAMSKAWRDRPRALPNSALRSPASIEFCEAEVDIFGRMARHKYMTTVGFIRLSGNVHGHAAFGPKTRTDPLERSRRSEFDYTPRIRPAPVRLALAYNSTSSADRHFYPDGRWRHPPCRLWLPLARADRSHAQEKIHPLPPTRHTGGT